MTRFKQDLANLRPVIGTFVNLRSPDTAELMSQMGFDYLLVGGEHSSIGPDTMLEMFRAIERGRATPLVRVADASPASVQWALDAGAQGVLFPRIRSVSDVRQAVSLCRYPPDGVRGLGPGRASGYGMNLLDYASTANSELTVMIQIETLEAVEQIEEIAAVPGVDLVFIGPGDLSQLLGVTGQLHHPKIQAIGNRVVEACAKHSVPVGILALDEEVLTHWKQQGVTFFTVGSDAILLGRACRGILDRWEQVTMAKTLGCGPSP